MKLIIVKSNNRYCIKRKFRFLFWTYWKYHEYIHYDYKHDHWTYWKYESCYTGSFDKAKERVNEILRYHDVGEEEVVWQNGNPPDKIFELTSKMIKAHSAGDFEQEELLIKEILKLSK